MYETFDTNPKRKQGLQLSYSLARRVSVSFDRVKHNQIRGAVISAIVLPEARPIWRHLKPRGTGVPYPTGLPLAAVLP